MAFQITRTFHNGERCCCLKLWEDDDGDEWVNSREEALAKIPRTLPKDPNFEGGLYAIEVIDGSTGKEIANVELSWPSGYRGAGYKASLWSGWLDPGNGQERVLIHDFKGKQDTWEACLAEVAETTRERREKEAQRKLMAAQEELANLKGG